MTRESQNSGWRIARCAALLPALLSPALPARAAAAEPPPAAPEAAEPAAPEEPAPEAESEGLAADSPVQFTLVPAFGNLGLRGSREAFFHYHRPPFGFYPALLRAVRRDEAGVPLDTLWWRNLGEADQKGFLDLHLRSAPTFLSLQYDSAEFYGDPQFPAGPFSSRRENRIRLHLEDRPRGPALDLALWDQNLAIPAVYRLRPARGIAYAAPEYAFRAAVPVAGGQLYLEPRFLEFDDRPGRIPDSSTAWLSGEFVRPAGDRADLSLGFDRVVTSVAGQDAARWTMFRLQGVVRPADALDVTAFYRRQEADLPFTTTSFAQRSSLAGIDVAAAPLRRLTLGAGLFHEAIRRRDGVAGGEEETAWTGGWAQLRAYDPDRGQLTLRFRERDLADAPPASIAGLPLTGSLFYTRERAADGRVDWFPAEWLDLYAMHAWRRRDNAERETRLSFASTTAGITAQIGARAAATVEYTLQRWSGDRTPFVIDGGNPPGLLVPRLFFSNAHLLTFSAAYRLSARSTLELTYNQARSTGGQSAREHLGLLQYRREVGREFYFSLGFGFEEFDDRAGGDYRAFPVLLEAGYRRTFR